MINSGKAVLPAAGFLVLLLAGCGGSDGPSPAACKSAMRVQYAAAVPSGKPGAEPSACKGVPAATITKLAGQIMAGQ